jgi:hypothetical protein
MVQRVSFVFSVQVEAGLRGIGIDYCWCRDEKSGKMKKKPRGGQHKPREIRELVLEIAKVTGLEYTSNWRDAQVGDQWHRPPDGSKHPQRGRDHAGPAVLVSRSFDAEAPWSSSCDT